MNSDHLREKFDVLDDRFFSGQPLIESNLVGEKLKFGANESVINLLI